MRVDPNQRKAWERLPSTPVRVRPDELVTDRYVPRPLYFGSAALRMAVEQALDENQDEATLPPLRWPPEPVEERANRGRPLRRDELWRAISRLSKPEARAFLKIANDFIAHRRPARLATKGNGYVIERTARYYSKQGDLGVEEAKHALDFVVNHLRAATITVQELDAAGVPVRRLPAPKTNDKGKQVWARHGYHFFFTESGCHDLAHCIGLLYQHGIKRPPTSRPLRGVDPEGRVLKVGKTQGAHRYIRCPDHDDHDPSAYLSERGVVHCFTCAADVGTWQDLGRGEVLYRSYVDAEVVAAQRIHAGQDPNPLASPTPDSEPTPPQPPFVIFTSGVRPSVLDLGFSVAARAGAAAAGAPGQSPPMKYLGHFGKREMADVGPTMSLVREYASGAVDHILRCRKLGLVYAKKTSRWMSKSYASSMDLLHALRSAEKRSKWPTMIAKARAAYAMATAAHVRHVRGMSEAEMSKARMSSDDLPDLYISVEHQTHRHEVGQKVPMDGNFVVRKMFPTDFEPAVTNWVLVDIDHIQIPWTHGPDAHPDEAEQPTDLDLSGGEGCYGDQVLASVAAKIGQILDQHPDYTGRWAMVRTGSRGVQVVAELETARWDPKGLWASEHFKRQVSNFSIRVLRWLREAGCTGGEIDRTAMQHHKFMRRPGWRIDKTNRLFRSRLIFATP